MCGTDYFNTKHRDVKISAVTKLLSDSEEVAFTDHEKEAMNKGRLGDIVLKNGGIIGVKLALAIEDFANVGNRY